MSPHGRKLTPSPKERIYDDEPSSLIHVPPRIWSVAGNTVTERDKIEVVECTNMCKQVKYE